MFFLNAKKLKPEVGTAVLFDSRIIHRGSPIAKKNLNNVKFEKGVYQAYLPEEANKYSIYCQIGTSKSIDSYMFDRLRRNGNADELNYWLKQIEFISKFDKKMTNQINLVLDPIKEKYKSYLS